MQIKNRSHREDKLLTWGDETCKKSIFFALNHTDLSSVQMCFFHSQHLKVGLSGIVPKNWFFYYSSTIEPEEDMTGRERESKEWEGRHGARILHMESKGKSMSEISRPFSSQSLGREGCCVKAKSRNNWVLVSAASTQVLLTLYLLGKGSHSLDMLLEWPNCFKQLRTESLTDLCLGQMMYKWGSHHKKSCNLPQLAMFVFL